MAYYQLNNKGGTDIFFDGKPSEEIRAQLKMNRFRWSPSNACWYKKDQSESTIQFVKSITGTEEASQENAILEPVEYPYIDINDVNTYVIDQSLQDREHDSSWIFRNNKRDRTKEIQELFSHYNKQVEEVLTTTENEYIIYKLKSALQRFKKNYYNTYIKYLSHKANNPSWAVTGRAGRNASRDQKMSNRQDKLLGELVEATETIKSEINRYKNKIRKDKEDQLKKQLENELNQPLQELKFKTETKDFNLYGNGNLSKVRFYTYENYSIAKVWGAFRVFDNATGKEIHSTKSNGTLKDAKAYVSLQVRKQKESLETV